MKRSRDNRSRSKSPIQKIEKSVSHNKSKNRTSRWSPAREDEPKVSNSESISIEETNKLRAKLGLAPLKTDPVIITEESSASDRLNSFVHAPAKNITEINKQNKIKEKLSIQKTKREALEVLSQVKSIISSNDVSTMSWINQMKEKKKEIEESKRKASRFEEMDEAFLGNSAFLQDYNSTKGNYSSDDLQGLKIQHKLDRFQEGQSTILTLRDANVLDEDENDILVNVNALDEEKAAENIKNRRAQKKLGGICADEDEDVMNGYRIKGILEKYDSEIEKEKKDFIVIGERGKYLAHHEMAMAKLENELKRTSQSLGETSLKVANEYLSEQEIAAKFKKRKRKVKVVRKIDEDQFQAKPSKDVKKEDEEFDENGLPKKLSSVFTISSSSQSNKQPPPKPLESSSDDEQDDFRNELEKTINKVKNSHKITIEAPEEVVTKYSAPSIEVNQPNVESKGITFDYTEEFYKNISNRLKGTNEARLNSSKTRSSRRTKITQGSDDDENISDEEAMKISASQLSSDDSELDDGEVKDDERKNESQNTGEHVLNDEPKIGKGCVSVLQLARQKGYLEKEDPKESGTVIITSKTLSAKNCVVEDKYGHEAFEAKFAKRDRANGPLTEFKDMKDYKPNVRLEYTDEYGREMDKKEAFRVLSHKFHGRTSGKKKTEKKLKKLKEEMILKGTMLSDTPLNTAEKLNKKLESEKVPYVVLSGKNVLSKSIMK